MLGWVIIAGLVVLGIYGISKTSGPGMFKIADRFLTGGNHITFTVIQNPGSKSVKHIPIGFGGIFAGGTLHAIEIRRGETKDFGKVIVTSIRGERLQMLIKVDVARNYTLTLPNSKPITSEYFGWISVGDWKKISPYLEPIKNMHYLFVD